MNPRFLIIHPGGIGDVLLALPAIRSLSQRYGAEEGALVASRPIGELLVLCQEIGRVFPLEARGLSDVLGGVIHPESGLDEWLRDCALTVAWMSDHDSRLSTTLSERGVGQSIIGSPLTGSLLSVHQSDRIQETVSQLKLDPPSEQPLNIPESAIIDGRRELIRVGVSGNQSYVVVHPGSGSVHKCCEPTLMADAIRWSYGKGCIPILIGGPADRDLVRRVQAHCPDPAPVINDAELTVIAGILKEADLFIGHDSGMAHLAAAVGVPSVVCFGPTDEQRWSPRGNTVTVVRGKRCHCLTWEAVQRCSLKPCLAVPGCELIRACEGRIR